MEKEVANLYVGTRASLGSLPVEILGFILRDAIGGPDLLTHFVVVWVCRQWRSMVSPFPFKPLPRRRDWYLYRKKKLGSELASEAARFGSVKLLRWLRKLGCPWENERVCSQAARGGHLKVLKWARKHSCPWNGTTCRKAARGGHLRVLKWARENGCPWEFKTSCAAALGGHVRVLKWVMANNCSWNVQTCSGAAKKDI